MMKITEIRTPALLVDLEKVKKNSQDMIDRCNALGVTLRPHMKTHKTLYCIQLFQKRLTERTANGIGDCTTERNCGAPRISLYSFPTPFSEDLKREAAFHMTGGTKRCIVVSTLSEAEFFANGGYDDITYGFPITPDKLPQAASLVERLQKFHVFVDNDVMLKALVNFTLPQGKKWSVFLKVDCGKQRAGVWYSDPYMISLAKAITSESSLIFAGVYLHCGNSYSATDENEIRESGEVTHDRLLGLINRLKEAGIECPTVGVGSTPNCSKPIKDLQGITEFHPGNYVFYDYQQSLIGSCKMENVAVRVLTRVIGVHPYKGHLLVDCGFTALSQDGMRRLPQDSFCFIEGHPNLKMVSMSQEIGKIMAAREVEPIDYSQYPIGSFLWIIPYHACATAYMHPQYYVHNGEEIIEKWVPNRGW